MLGRIAVGCLATCFLVACSQDGGNTPAGGSGDAAGGGAAAAGQKRHQGAGFSVEVPPGWTVFAPTGSFTIYPDGKSGDASMTIIIEPYGPGKTPETYLAHEKESAGLQQGTLESSDVQIAGHPAYRRVSVWEPDKGTAADRIAYTIAAPSGVCKIHCTVKQADEFAKFLTTYEQVVQSLKID